MATALAGGAAGCQDSTIESPHRPPRRPQPLQEFLMAQWIKPQATDLRYGFEITMYISNR